MNRLPLLRLVTMSTATAVAAAAAAATYDSSSKLQVSQPIIQSVGSFYPQPRFSHTVNSKNPEIMIVVIC